MFKEIAGQPFLYAVNILMLVALALIALYGVVAHMSELYEENQWKKWEKNVWAKESESKQVSQ